MAYSVYHGSTNISDYVVACPPVPLLDTTWDGQITLPSMSLTVIANAQAYAKDDRIYFKDGTSIFAWFIIEDIQTDYTANTVTLELVDVLKLLERTYARDLPVLAFENASSPADYYGGFNQRGYYTLLSDTPHRVSFVQVAFYVKAAIVAAGITTKDHVDISELDGEIESGFVRWDEGADEEAAINKEDLCFHPAQIAYAKLGLGLTEAKYEGATLLDVVLYALQVLDANIAYSDDDILLVNRDTDADPADDDVYDYRSSSFLNQFNWFGLTISYLETWNIANGFNDYVLDNLGGETLLEESWTHPDTEPDDVRPVEKSWPIMNHAVVHWRNVLEDKPYCYEMHLGAYELGDPDWDAYKFGNQFVKILAGRMPTSGVVETWETAPDPEALGARPLLKKALDIVNYKTILEY